MSRVSNIINTVSRKQADSEKYTKELRPERERLNKYLEREEEEKAKDEGQKTHERYRRKQKSVDGADLTSLIRPARPAAKRPGTFFYGPLKKLAEDFDNIPEMLRHMTLGQNQKYSQDGNRLLNRSGKVVYDEKTQECFE